jgi:membrane AbrB-like protein
LTLLVVGIAGAWIADRTGVPAGVIIGALIAGALYRLAGGDPDPWRGRFGRAGRLLFGTVIGAAFGPAVLDPLKTALLPMIVITAAMIGLGLLLGWALGRFTPLDSTTAILSAVPGGLPVMVAIADDSAADAPVVAAIHFSRLTVILLVMPILVPLLAAGHPGNAAAAPLDHSVELGRTVATLAGGLISGLLALRLRVPTGDLIGPIFVLGGVNLLGAEFGPLADGFRESAIVLVGTSVGAGVARDSLRRLKQAALPTAAVVLVLITTGLALGWGLSQLTSLDLASALLSSVPGGASTMAAVAHDVGGDMRLVAALHLTRQLTIFVLMPSLLSYLLRAQLRGCSAHSECCSDS